MKNVLRLFSGWALFSAGLVFAVMSLQDSGPYGAIKLSVLTLAFIAAGLFLLLNPQGISREAAVWLGVFAIVLMGTVSGSYEAGGSLGHPLLEIVIMLFIASYGLSLFAMIRYAYFRSRVTGLELGKKIRD